MKKTLTFILMIFLFKCVHVSCYEERKEDVGVNSIENEPRTEDLDEISASTQSWKEAFTMYPTVATWSVQTGIPVTSEESDIDLDGDTPEARRKKGGGMRKKMKKYMMPLLIAYKLKFFTLIPVMIGGLILLTGATGLAGFFFALFAAVMGLKGGGHEHH